MIKKRVLCWGPICCGCFLCGQFGCDPICCGCLSWSSFCCGCFCRDTNICFRNTIFNQKSLIEPIENCFYINPPFPKNNKAQIQLLLATKKSSFPPVAECKVEEGGGGGHKHTDTWRVSLIASIGNAFSNTNYFFKYVYVGDIIQTNFWY